MLNGLYVGVLKKLCVILWGTIVMGKEMKPPIGINRKRIYLYIKNNVITNHIRPDPGQQY